MEPIKEETTPKNKTQKLTEIIEIPVKGNSLLKVDKISEPVKE